MRHSFLVRLIGTALGAGVAVCLTQRKSTVHAFWTTNSEPNVKWDHNWDRRGEENASSLTLVPDYMDRGSPADDDIQQPTATRHLLLVRHGQTTIEKDDTKRILTQLGRVQADFCGQRLKAMGLPFTKMVSSTLARAVDTADIFHRYLPGLPWQQDPILCEGIPVPPEPAVGRWKPEKQFHVDGVRLEVAFRRYFHRADCRQSSDSYEIIVCHANIIRYFVCRSLQLPPEAWNRMGLNHASITWVRIRPTGQVTMLQYGDSGFIPAEQVSFI
ncbi:serine/threonine-protein phosphatase PGAM5, mitochondrial-like [Ostrea edulis]|uniref:serine/threonine-protein phosphatase PGAM5, mitochondrial-like n=1 Tax=Ostrea edulis TaxID=37623 RepID=UPI0024AFB33F|nr:serine/threonine-protein phosphatase PGAM5, mitochondrial-like [Ostrea edulis]